MYKRVELNCPKKSSLPPIFSLVASLGARKTTSQPAAAQGNLSLIDVRVSAQRTRQPYCESRDWPRPQHEAGFDGRGLMQPCSLSDAPQSGGGVVGRVRGGDFNFSTD